MVVECNQKLSKVGTRRILKIASASLSWDESYFVFVNFCKFVFSATNLEFLVKTVIVIIMKNTAANILNDASSNVVIIKSEPSGPDGEKMVFQSPVPNKRPASLDLKNSCKKRLLTPSPLLIESPETHQKPLTTPDLDKILHFLPTPQPGSIFQSKAGTVTSEQEAFGKGFEEALHSLHNNNNKQNHVCMNDATSSSTVTTTSTMAAGMSGGSFTYTELGMF